MKRKGFTLIELLVVIAVIGILASLLLPALSSVLEKSKQMKCKANLSNIGKSMVLYKQDYGRHKKFTEADGERFICSLHFMNILLETAIFLCPSVADETTAEELNTNGTITGSTFTSPSTDVDEEGATSYAARKNNNQRQYPGFFTLKRDTTITPMGSDDWQGAEGEGNHEAGQFVNFLFADAHVDDLRIKAVGDEDVTDNHGYDFFQTAAFPDVNNPNLADPITN